MKISDDVQRHYNETIADVFWTRGLEKVMQENFENSTRESEKNNTRPLLYSHLLFYLTVEYCTCTLHCTAFAILALLSAAQCTCLGDRTAPHRTAHTELRLRLFNTVLELSLLYMWCTVRVHVHCTLYSNWFDRSFV